MEYYDNEHYTLKVPVSVYGQFFPAGTIYKHINADWWYPFHNDALMPSYAVHLYVIRNNPQYFEQIMGQTDWRLVSDKLPSESGWFETNNNPKVWFSKDEGKFKVSENGCVYYHSVSHWRPIS